MGLEQEFLKYAYDNYSKNEGYQYTITTKNAEERFLYYSCLNYLFKLFSRRWLYHIDTR